jgi:hypothetical protein
MPLSSCEVIRSSQPAEFKIEEADFERDGEQWANEAFNNAPEQELALAENNLTGLMTDEETAARRPVAVVINNLKKALPQSGVSKADIIYEVLAEGDITRLVAVFKDMSSEKIGPVRSARDYFLAFAFDNGAIFAHHGGSPAAYSLITRSSADNIDGMYASDAFWRDPSRLSVAGMYEHSSYTDGRRLVEKINNENYLNIATGDSPFNFKDIEKTEVYQTIAITYSKGYVRRFEYDADSGLYLAFNGDDALIDEETGEQLSVANVIAQFAEMHVIQGDAAGRRAVRLTGDGKGFLFTNGFTSPLTWRKERLDDATMWFDGNGDKLTVSAGKTWINVYNGEVIVETGKKAVFRK